MVALETNKVPMRAARAAAPGTTVVVAPGTYSGGFRINVDGKPGERIVFIRTLVKGREQKDREGGRAIERVATGQYL